MESGREARPDLLARLPIVAREILVVAVPLRAMPRAVVPLRTGGIRIGPAHVVADGLAGIAAGFRFRVAFATGAPVAGELVAHIVVVAVAIAACSHVCLLK